MRFLTVICFLLNIGIAVAQLDTCPVTGPNLIVNGDFEQGYFGFTSDFGRGQNNATLGNCATQGWILVAQINPHVSYSCQIYPPNLSAMYGGPNTQTHPDPSHPSNTSVATVAICNNPLPDHTTGDGFFLTIDPDALAGRAYWKQTVAVCPNTDYIFSVWVRNISSIPAPFFHFEVGGVPINSPTVYPNNFWVKTAAKWNSGNVSGNVLIELVNDQPGCIENDVAIDDVFFGICGGVFLTCDTLQRFCSGQLPGLITLSGNAYGFSPAQFQWQKFNSLNFSWGDVAGASDSVFFITSPSPADAGSYRLLAAGPGNIQMPNCRMVSERVRIEVLPEYSIVETVNICQGETYMGHSASGIFIDSLSTVRGCDSVRTLILTVSPVLSNEVAASICAGENYAGHSASGTYVDTFQTTAGCDSIRTLHLSVHEKYLSEETRTICPGSNVVFNGAVISSAGLYRDTLRTAHGCDSVFVLNLSVAPSRFLGNDTTICLGNSFELHSPSDNTIWFDNSTSKSKTVFDSGLYWATMTDGNGCKITDSIRVQFNVKAYFPNVFSPNDDGANDGFLPVFSDLGFERYSLQIFDRWGNLLFAANNPTEAWDGRHNGKPCSPGVYAYVVSIEKKPCAKTILKGDVTIVR